MTEKQKDKIRKLEEELKEIKKYIKDVLSGKEVLPKKYTYMKGTKCAICGERTILETHHLKPRMWGGKDNSENLITLCKGCHFFMHCNPKLIMREKLSHKKKTKRGMIGSMNYHLIGKRGKDKKTRKERLDKGIHRIKKGQEE